MACPYCPKDQWKDDSPPPPILARPAVACLASLEWSVRIGVRGGGCCGQVMWSFLFLTARRRKKAKKEISRVKPLFLQKSEAPAEDGEKRFDPSGYDKDLVENLERDIVQKNPNVHW